MHPQMKQPKTFKTKSKEIAIYLVFVCIATAVWWGHALSSVRNTVLPIQVCYTGIPDDVAFADKLPEVIHIKVRDTGERLRAYHSVVPELSFDLSDQLVAEHGLVHLNQDLVRRTLTDLLHGTTNIQEIHPAEFSTTYYHEQSKVVPIHVCTTLQPAIQYHMVQTPEWKANKVKIFGSREVLSKIHSIDTESITISDLKDTVVSKIGLVLPEGVRTMHATTEVVTVSEMYTEKQVVQKIHAHHIPAGYQLHLFPSEVTITFHVSMSRYAEIDENNFDVDCYYSPKAGNTLTVQCSHTNRYISQVNISPQEVEYLLEAKP